MAVKQLKLLGHTDSAGACMLRPVAFKTFTAVMEVKIKTVVVASLA